MLFLPYCCLVVVACCLAVFVLLLATDTYHVIHVPGTLFQRGFFPNDRKVVFLYEISYLAVFVLLLLCFALVYHCVCCTVRFLLLLLIRIQYATDVKNLLFLARPEL